MWVQGAGGFIKGVDFEKSTNWEVLRTQEVNRNNFEVDNLVNCLIVIWQEIDYQYWTRPYYNCYEYWYAQCVSNRLKKRNAFKGE